ncbi:MAG: FtsX-like permease family protein [Streptococcaceae bacterium]|jgi:putative ABC transport system permease protein|nr:FtsX-like permease family protein [Streptococcaceae bacterium]
MRNKSLDLLTIIKQNFKGYPLRSIGFILLMSFLSFIIFFSSLIGVSLSNGMESTKKRLGADILIVPKENASDIEGILLKGKPSTFYLDAALVDKIQQTKGVKEVTTQVDVGSLDAACCATSIQLVGIDTQTDFVVKPWISRVYDLSKLRDDEIIIGNSISGSSGGSLLFFDKPFKIVAKLEKTGMGYDSTTFMNQATARKMARLRAEKLGNGEIDDYKRLVSAVLVNVQDDTTAFLVSKSLSVNLANEPISVIKRDNIIENTSKNVNSMLVMLQWLILIIWLLTLAIISVLLVVSLNERRKEIAIYRLLGLAKVYVTRMFVIELILINLLGLIFGLTSGYGIFALFQQLIEQKLSFPFLIPTISQVVKTTSSTILSTLVITAVAAIYSTVRINQLEISSLIRED